MWHQGRRTCGDREEEEEVIKTAFKKMLEVKEEGLST